MPVSDLTSVADGSVRLLLIDESAPGDYIPWQAIERKLVRDNPVVITFAPTRAGYGRHALFVVPTTVFPEMTDDVPAAIDSPAATFRVSAPLVAAPEGVVNPADFFGDVFGIPAGDALRERADAIRASGRGSLFTYADGVSTPVRNVTPDVFWTSLNEGGCWIDDAGGTAAQPVLNWTASESGEVADAELPLVAVVSERHAATGPASPILSKLDQESNLYVGRHRVALNPETARASNVEDGDRAILETALGQRSAAVLVDSTVPPGIVEVAADPEVLDICGAYARAKVVPA